MVVAAPLHYAFELNTFPRRFREIGTAHRYQMLVTAIPHISFVSVSSPRTDLPFGYLAAAAFLFGMSDSFVRIVSSVATPHSWQFPLLPAAALTPSHVKISHNRRTRWSIRL